MAPLLVPVVDPELTPEVDPVAFELLVAALSWLVLAPLEDPPEVDSLELPLLCEFEPPSGTVTVPLRVSCPQATIATSARAAI
jgi:hypothetical protein